MKKIISILLILIIIININLWSNTVSANFSIDSASLYSKGSFNNYLYYGDIGIVFNYVVYEKDGVEYPAYCLNKDLDGVTQSESYSVNTNELLTDIGVWRAIINGYPYKTVSELGCQTKEEAFIATKQAVYCMLYNRSVEDYFAKDERSQRVLNALTQIVTNARNSTEIKQSAKLEIVDVTNEWEQDNVDSNYIFKTFTVLANANLNSYIVQLEDINIEGTKVVNEQNEEKNEFNYGENFKILMPIKNLQNDGSFKINVQGEVQTKPILYGYSANRNMQDYAITGNIYEDGSGEKTIYYLENNTKIKIVKKDENNTALEGVKFNLLDTEKQIVFSDLTTNKEGEIIIKNLNPGKYYIEETSTLNGYDIYSELIEVDVAYNEELTLSITNSKENIQIEKPEIKENNIEVAIKLPKTGM